MGAKGRGWKTVCLRDVLKQELFHFPNTYLQESAPLLPVGPGSGQAGVEQRRSWMGLNGGMAAEPED